MRAILVVFVLSLGMLMSVQAQDDPAPSPAHSFTQTVGTTKITVEYSRPGVKGRTVYGDLVPYDEIWRFGANTATKFSFDKDVTVGGAELAAGDYAVLAKPSKDSWELHFFPYESGRWSSYTDQEGTIAKSAQVADMGDVNVETFMIAFDNLRDQSATLHAVWENTDAVFEVGVK